MKPTPIPKSFASLLNPAFWSKISRITSLQYTWDILWMRKYFLVAVGSLESDLVMQTAIHHISAKKLWWLKEANLQVSFFFSDIIIFILLTGSNNRIRNYEFEFSRFIWPIRIHFTSLVCLFLQEFVKIHESSFRNWMLDPVSKILVHQLLCSWW